MATFDRSSLAGGSPARLPTAPRGRGAIANVAHRFQNNTREQDDDGWYTPPVAGDATDAVAHQPVRLVTTIEVERARTLMSRNTSPDIPFDVAVNPYRGCEHGCVYCYARPTHAYLGYSPGLDFETRLVVKSNAVQALTADLAKPGYRASPINLGSATDIYQPLERDWRVTRGLLTLLHDTRHPVTLITKNALVERDIDILADLARDNLVAVYVSITSLDNTLSSRLEPRASAPWRRLKTVRTLADAGIPVGVLVAPVIPFITDEHLEHIVAEAAQAGARYGNYTVIRLPYEVKDIFEAWLHAHYPDRAERVLHRIEDMRGGRRNDPRFGARMRGTGLWADLLKQRFEVAARRAGLNRQRLQLNSRLFIPPAALVRAGVPAASAGLHSDAPGASATVQFGLFD